MREIPNMCVDVFVPAGDHPFTRHIAPRSMIVGERMGNGQHKIYYEGNLYGACNLNTPEEKLAAAWGRMWTRYPTVAMGIVPNDSIIHVGTYNPATRELTILNQSAYDRWMSTQPDSKQS